jgi:hypothetical protein
MVGSTMVLGVSVLPCKVGHQQSLVNDESDNIIKRLERTKGTVSAFMSQHPWASKNSSHPKGIK